MERHYLHSLAPGFDKDEVLTDLMNDYGNDVWNFAYFLTKQTDAADDISQDVFIAVYDALYSFRRESSVKSWLLTITRNKSLNYLKRSFIRRVILMGSIERNESLPSAENVALNRMDSHELWNKVMTLPRKYREILVLSYHYELSGSEIGQMLHISEGTVKSRIHRAKSLLGKLMSMEKEDE